MAFKINPLASLDQCSTANDSETAHDPQNGPQMILNRKWSSKSTTNDPETPKTTYNHLHPSPLIMRKKVSIM